MGRKSNKYLSTALLSFLLVLCVCAFFNVRDSFGVNNVETLFDYPLNIDIKPLVKDVLAGKKPSIEPINYYPFTFLTNVEKCITVNKLDLFIVVKSAINHFDNRMAIRLTYGEKDIMPGRVIRILFFIGIQENETETQKKIESEITEFDDIIQMNFVDSYFNKTIKTMMSFRWVYEHCSTADYYLFTDDDMYISIFNLLNYLESKNPSITNGHLYAGYMFKTNPHKKMVSKWRVSSEEYPWKKWPSYVTARAYVVSNKSMKVLYVASLFIKHFRFDDIYLSIVAKKAGIVPSHCDNFYFYKKPYSKEGYINVIASHGYSDRDTLIKVWHEQNN